MSSVKRVTGVRHETLAIVQKELTASQHRGLAKRVGVLKGGRIYNAHSDPGLEHDVLKVVASSSGGTGAEHVPVATTRADGPDGVQVPVAMPRAAARD